MKYSIIVIVLFLSLETQAQVAFFEKQLGDSFKISKGRSIIQADDSTIYTLGFSNGGPFGGNDFQLFKLDMYGNVLWEKFFGFSFDDYSSYMDFNNDGNIWLLGESYNVSGDINAALFEIDTAGNILNQYILGVLTRNESLKKIIATQDDNYIMSGFASDSNGLNDIFIKKIDALGNPIWDFQYGTDTTNEYAHNIIELADGDYLVTYDIDLIGNSIYDIGAMRLTSDGTIVWDTVFVQPQTEGCQAIYPMQNGNYLIIGEGTTPSSSEFDFIFIEIDGDGNLIYYRKVGDALANAAFSAVEHTDGSWIVTGYSPDTMGTALDLVVFKYNLDGSISNFHYYGGSNIDIGYQIIKSKHNGYLIIGTDKINTVSYQYLLHIPATDFISGLWDEEVNNDCSNVLLIHNEIVVSDYMDHQYILSDLSGKCIDKGIITKSVINMNTYLGGHFFLKLYKYNRHITTLHLVKY